jgi:cytochrome c oxidase subunit 2
MAAACALTLAFPGASWALNDHTPEWETVWRHLLADIGVFGVIFGAISLYFLVSFARKSPGEVGKGPVLTFGVSLAMGIIPVFIFLADDFYLAAQGWHLWNSQRRVPAGAYEIKLTGRMWGWDFEYPEGGVTTSSDVQYDDKGKVTGVDGEGLVVPQGKPVVLRMTSTDTIHSFFIPKHRIKEDVMPGRVTYLWFNPKDPGKYKYTCTEFCGTNHSRMYGDVNVLPAEEFAKWIEGHKAPAKAPAPAADAAPAAPAAAPAAPAGGEAPHKG